MRIWLQKHTVEGRVPLLDATYRRHVAAMLDESAEVRVEGLPPATYQALLPAELVRFGAAEAMFSWFFAAQALVAERAGYDAYVIGASTDPGLFEARAVASIPVLGYGETAFFECARRGLPFGIVGCIPELAELLAANVDRYGLTRWLSGFSYLEDGPSLIRQALQGEPDDFLARFAEGGRRLIEQGARVIIPGEGLPNEVLFGAGVSRVDQTPILDGDGLLLRAAAHQVEIEARGIIPFPGETFQHRRLPDGERDRLFDLFSPASMAPPVTDPRA